MTSVTEYKNDIEQAIKGLLTEHGVVVSKIEIDWLYQLQVPPHERREVVAATPQAIAYEADLIEVGGD